MSVLNERDLFQINACLPSKETSKTSHHGQGALSSGRGILEKREARKMQATAITSGSK